MLVADSSPLVTIRDDGAQERLFVDAQVRELTDGTFAISDASSLVLRALDAGGRLVRTISTRGNGPGEWSGQYRWELTGDTIDTFGQPPLGPRRVQSYSVDGELLGGFESTAPGTGPLVVTARLASGMWLARVGQIARPLTQFPAAGSIWLDSVSYVILAVEGGRGKVAAEIATPAVIPHVSFPSGLTRIPIAIAPAPLLPRQMIAASGGIVWCVNGESGSFEVIAHDGQTQARGVLPIPPRRLSKTRIEQELRTQMAAAVNERERRRLTAQFDANLAVDRSPVVDSLIAAPDGGMWMRRFAVGDRTFVRYVRVNREGRIVGEAVLPAWLRLQHITPYAVLGTRSVADGTEEVVKLRLR